MAVYRDPLLERLSRAPIPQPKKKPPVVPGIGTPAVGAGVAPPPPPPPPGAPAMPQRPAFTPSQIPALLSLLGDSDLFQMASDRANNAIEPQRLALERARQAARRNAEGDVSQLQGVGESAGKILSGNPDTEFSKILAAQVADDVRHRQYSGQQEQGDYEGKLVELAAQYPQYRDQALDALYEREMQKLSMRLNIENQDIERQKTQEGQYEFDVGTATDARDYGEKVREFDTTTDATNKQNAATLKLSAAAQKLEERKFQEDKRQFGEQIAIQRRQTRVSERAQNTSEYLAGETTRHNVAGERLDAAQISAQARRDAANLQLQKGNQGLRAAEIEASLSKAAAAGKKVNASLSKALHYVVDQNGDPVLDGNGNRIKVAAAPTAKDKSNLRAAAMKEAVGLRGDPIEATTVKNALGNSVTPRGKFLAAPGAKGVFPGNKSSGIPSTTNDPKKARRDSDMTFAQAQAYLVQAYNMTRAQARAALIAAGWQAAKPQPAPYRGPH